MEPSTADPSATARPELRTSLVRIDDQTFAGYVVDESSLLRRFTVELLIDGYPLKVARSDIYIRELLIEGVGDGRYGFTFQVPRAVLDQALVVEVRVANTDIPVGVPINLAAAASDTLHALETHEIRWLGGLRFDGWCVADGKTTPTVTAVIDGDRVVEVKAISWTNVGNPSVSKLARRFDLHLPERFADGSVKRVHFVRESGEPLMGSPLAIVAFPDGLRQTIARLSERSAEDDLRAAQIDCLFPASIPFSNYAAWCKRFPVPRSEGRVSAPIAIALVGGGSAKGSLRSLKKNDVADWVAASLPADGPSGFRPEHLQNFLTTDAKPCKQIIFTHSEAQFDPTALRRIVHAFGQFPDAVAAYGDFDLCEDDGTRWPIALPALDYERLLEQGYCAHLFALHHNKVVQALKTGASDLYSLFMLALENDFGLHDRIVHIPGSLASLPPLNAVAEASQLAKATRRHLGDRAIAVEVAASHEALFPAVHVLRAMPPQDTTTIVIVVRNQPALLRSCLRSIGPAVALGHIDLIIIDNGSSDPEMLGLLEDLPRRPQAEVISAPGDFNFSQLNNLAAERAQGEFLCLLNRNVRALDSQWLREMQRRIGPADVGAVGPLLLWPSGGVQHGGMVLGANFAVAHAFTDRIGTDPGYTDLLRVAHECSAVTAACLLTRRRDYLDVGGLDELHFPANFNDVDYCLKLRAKNKRIIFTPHARLHHLGSADRAAESVPDRLARTARELQSLRARWGEYLIADPYYSPTLSLDNVPFSALAWPPRSRDARVQSRPVAPFIPPGF